MWETIVNDLFISTHQVNDEVVYKPNSLWTKEEKRKFEIDFKTKNFMIMSLDDIKLTMFIVVIPPRKYEIFLKKYMEFLQISNKRR